MDKKYWRCQIDNALELVTLNPTNRGIRALKSMIRKYEKNFNEKLNIPLPLIPDNYDKKYLSFKEFHSETNNRNNDS
jgi:hypothetical protein